MKNFNKRDRPYKESEWETDKDWLAQRIAFLWHLRDTDPQHYCRNGFGQEKENLYAQCDYEVIMRAQDIYDKEK